MNCLVTTSRFLRRLPSTNRYPLLPPSSNSCSTAFDIHARSDGSPSWFLTPTRIYSVTLDSFSELIFALSTSQELIASVSPWMFFSSLSKQARVCENPSSRCRHLVQAHQPYKVHHSKRLAPLEVPIILTFCKVSIGCLRFF